MAAFCSDVVLESYKHSWHGAGVLSIIENVTSSFLIVLSEMGRVFGTGDEAYRAVEVVLLQ